MAFNCIRLHYIVQAICVNGEKAEAMRWREVGSTMDGRKGSKKEKQEEKRGGGEAEVDERKGA